MDVFIVNTLAGVALISLGALILVVTGPRKVVKPVFLVTLTGYAFLVYGVVMFLLGM